jgi:carotenoid cleavage oxygenase
MFDRDRRGPGESLPTLDRWTINLSNPSTGAVHTECRDDRSQEFPRINENLTGARHRFGYTVGIDGGFQAAGGPDLVSSLYKHDYATGSTTLARLDPDLMLGEVCFVPNPAKGGADAEDAGILMGYGSHRSRDEGQLLLLDAQTLETVATVHLPQRVPMGFHGNWAPSS